MPDPRLQAESPVAANQIIHNRNYSAITWQKNARTDPGKSTTTKGFVKAFLGAVEIWDHLLRVSAQDSGSHHDEA